MKNENIRVDEYFQYRMPIPYWLRIDKHDGIMFYEVKQEDKEKFVLLLEDLRDTVIPFEEA